MLQHNKPENIVTEAINESLEEAGSGSEHVIEKKEQLLKIYNKICEDILIRISPNNHILVKAIQRQDVLQSLFQKI